MARELESNKEAASSLIFFVLLVEGSQRTIQIYCSHMNSYIQGCGRRTGSGRSGLEQYPGKNSNKPKVDTYIYIMLNLGKHAGCTELLRLHCKGDEQASGCHLQE